MSEELGSKKKGGASPPPKEMAGFFFCLSMNFLNFETFIGDVGGGLQPRFGCNSCRAMFHYMIWGLRHGDKRWGFHSKPIKPWCIGSQMAMHDWPRAMLPKKTSSPHPQGKKQGKIFKKTQEKKKKTRKKKGKNNKEKRERKGRTGR